MPRRSRKSRERKLPLPPAFKAHRAEHWLDRHEREREEQERRRQASDEGAAAQKPAAGANS